MGNPKAIHVKARAVVRQFGHSDGDPYREYTDWHIEIRAGSSYVSVWSSARMVFLSLGGIPVFHVPGAWEQYLDRLFHRVEQGELTPDSGSEEDDSLSGRGPE